MLNKKLGGEKQADKINILRDDNKDKLTRLHNDNKDNDLIDKLTRFHDDISRARDQNNEIIYELAQSIFDDKGRSETPRDIFDFIDDEEDRSETQRDISDFIDDDKDRSETPKDISDFIDDKTEPEPEPEQKPKPEATKKVAEEFHEVTMPVPDAIKERVINDRELLDYFSRSKEVSRIPKEYRSYNVDTNKPIFEVYKYYDVNSRVPRKEPDITGNHIKIMQRRSGETIENIPIVMTDDFKRKST